MGNTMVGTGSTIPARSKEQALDWSLVLLSQGIESELEPAEDGAWQIAVDENEFGRAAHVLRLYCLENRRRPESTVAPAKLVFDWGQTWFFALLMLIFALSETRFPMLRDFGRMDTSAFLAGEWWRPLTAVLLHHDAAHLVANVSIGMIFLGLAGGLFGTWRAFLISYASGAMAYLVGALAFGEKYHSLGASGMVMGALGLLTSFSLANVDGLDRRKFGYQSVAGGLLLLVLLGFNPQPHTDVLAHLSGFFFGLSFGLLTAIFRRSLLRFASQHRQG